MQTTPAGPSAPHDLRARREAVVREHLDAENDLEFDRALHTFDHPRYELIATGQVFDGPEEVMEYYRSTRSAFPDQRNENVVLRHAEDAVIVEFDLRGTHRGAYLGFEPTGREFTCRMAAVFEFEGDRMVCERVYFDLATIASQLGLLGQVARLAEQMPG
ncbi:ester cyclase [Thermomonospora umbrina]|uniref:Steroid delta-isomerase-like uncharacterized protein n=1 Tax=Thermomonospora umbrina TaxID=111806 RepID=A0A3D9T5Q7_9ACTN|nr:ester cyclase [Thermomonospora umbrina]REF00035.1 steroid delta-isomerase-like uncharacterized protein [Thermomonospora umbrina]